MSRYQHRQPLAVANVFPSICEMYMFERTPDGARVRWGSRNITMASLAKMLPHAPFIGPSAVNRPVVDETGLNGAFDFQVEYGPELASPTAAEGQRKLEYGPGSANPTANEVQRAADDVSAAGRRAPRPTEFSPTPTDYLSECVARATRPETHVGQARYWSSII